MTKITTPIITDDDTSITIIIRSTDGSAHGEAVLNGAFVVTHDAADIVISGDACVGKGDILYGTIFDIAEKPLIIIAAVDTDAADGVALTVEGALKAMAGDSDGGIVLAVGINTIGVVGNVVGKHEVFARIAVDGILVARAAIDALCQQV